MHSYPEGLAGIELMGENVKSKLAKCGEEVNIYPMAKIAKPENVEIGDYSQIFDMAFIHGGGKVVIGSHTSVTWQVIIEGYGDVTIGNGTLLALGVKLITSLSEHNGYRVGERLEEGEFKKKRGAIVIGDEVLIGVNSVIMPGVTIGEGAVVGVNSLVTKDLEPWSINVGTPCKKVGTREKPKGF